MLLANYKVLVVLDTNLLTCTDIVNLPRNWKSLNYLFKQLLISMYVKK